MRRTLLPIFVVYLILMAGVGSWGIPKPGRMFGYFMDEWHGTQALRAIVRHGTISVEGAAWGTLGYYLLELLWIGPWVVTGVVNSDLITSPATGLVEQGKMFMILRVSTWIWGLAGLYLAARIGKERLKLGNMAVAGGVWLMMLSPAWLGFSSVYKYDVAVATGILMFVYRMFVYADDPSRKNWWWAAVVAVMGMTIKISMIFLFALMGAGWWMFTLDKAKRWRELAGGAVIAVVIFICLGIPDVVFMGKGGQWDTWLKSVFVTRVADASNLVLGKHWMNFLFGEELGQIFGWMYALGIAGWGWWIVRGESKRRFLVIGGVVFVVSMLTMGIWGGGNRSMVVVPFLALGAMEVLNKLKWKWAIVGIVCWQMVMGLGWWAIKMGDDPREAAAGWMRRNIPRGREVGIENIPIYQRLPDVLVSDFYGGQYEKEYEPEYKVREVYLENKDWPETVVIVNGDFEVKYLRESRKKEILKRLADEGYVRVARFEPAWGWYSVFGDKLVWEMAGLTMIPAEISIFRK